jgi:hypothetical protein
VFGLEPGERGRAVVLVATDLGIDVDDEESVLGTGGNPDANRLGQAVAPFVARSFVERACDLLWDVRRAPAALAFLGLEPALLRLAFNDACGKYGAQPCLAAISIAARLAWMSLMTTPAGRVA